MSQTGPLIRGAAHKILKRSGVHRTSPERCRKVAIDPQRPPPGSQQPKTKSICKAMREAFLAAATRREPRSRKPETTQFATGGWRLTAKIFPLPLIGRMIYTG